MSSNKLKNTKPVEKDVGPGLRSKNFYSTTYSQDGVANAEIISNWSNKNRGRPKSQRKAEKSKDTENPKQDTNQVKDTQTNIEKKSVNSKKSNGKKAKNSEVEITQVEKENDSVVIEDTEKIQEELILDIEEPEQNGDTESMVVEEKSPEKDVEKKKNTYAHCLRKRSAVKKNYIDDIFYDLTRNTQKPKKRKANNKNYFKTTMNTPLHTPSKHLINYSNRDPESGNYINSIHFFNKRNAKTNKFDTKAPNYKIKVDDSQVLNIFERFMRNEKIFQTDTVHGYSATKDGAFVEPCQEIYNTFYKVYEVFKDSLEKISTTNQLVENFNQKMVKPFYENDEFKKTLKEEQQNPTVTQDLFKNETITIDDPQKTISDSSKNLIVAQQTIDENQKQENLLENTMQVEKKENDSKNSCYEQDKVENISNIDENGKKADSDQDNTKNNYTLNQILANMHEINEETKKRESYINCDQIYFNFDFLVEKLGHFDVLLVDPPWRIRGGQKNDSQFMFSNSKFCLEYNTMSNQEIKNLQIEKLSKKGFIFLWILANQINIASEILNKWGYELIDILVWVKLREGKVYLSHGYYFMHSYEICQIGYKCPMGETVEYISKVSNNLLFANIRKKSQKPDELYDIIDMIMPGSKKCEIFARNNNLRPGWFSQGNQLGPQFDKWKNNISCDICEEIIKIGTKRYKSKLLANTDICETCWINKNDGKFDENDYFVLNNDIDEDVLHQYHRCNMCFIEPIWGTRFTCKTCEDFDLCEACFDKNLEMRAELNKKSECMQEKNLPNQNTDLKILEENNVNSEIRTFDKSDWEKLHPTGHDWEATEIAKLAGGQPAHQDSKCNGCYQKPIIGVVFKCSECTNFCLCQNCYFIKGSKAFKDSRGHKAEHNYEIFIEAHSQKASYTCFSCDLVVSSNVYKCENCFNFYFCEKCFMNRVNFKTNMATTHKQYHKFLKIAN